MGKIYVNQTKLELTFDVGSDITGATVIIEGKDPNGASITPLATTTLNATRGKVQFISSTTPSFTISGTYTLWCLATFSDGKILIGEPAKLNIYEKGT